LAYLLHVEVGLEVDPKPLREEEKAERKQEGEPGEAP
jgi:hypothetical protein